MALKRGYESQEERVHIAVMQQFPQISIGFDQARDNANVYTTGFGVSMTVPILNRNKGQIAINRATRQQLFDQYTSRFFQARADIAELLITIALINKQIILVRHAIPDLANLVKAYQSAIEIGQVDVYNYYVAWNNLTNKKIDLLTLELQLVQAGIALEVASGLYHVATDFNENKL
jgi:outer membrane protein TolC